MPDTTLTSAIDQLQNHQTQLDMDGVAVGVSRQAIDIVLDALARAGLEAGKAEESMRLKAARVIEKQIEVIVNEHGSYEPDTNYTNLPDWAETVCEELENSLTAIRALPLTGVDKP